MIDDLRDVFLYLRRVGDVRLTVAVVTVLSKAIEKSGSSASIPSAAKTAGGRPVHVLFESHALSQ